MTIVERDAICTLIPHSGAMCLIDAVERWDADAILCSSSQHRSADNPLRVEGRLAPLHGIEFAAQAMAVHTGLVSGQSSKPRLGLLLSVRQCIFHCERLDSIECPLEISARRIAGNQEAVSYGFTIEAAGTVLVEGRLNVMLRQGGVT